MNEKNSDREDICLQDLPCLIINKGSMLPGETGIVNVEKQHDLNALKYAEETQSSEIYVYCVSEVNGQFSSYGVIARVVEFLVFQDERIKMMLQPIFRYKANTPIMDANNGCWLVNAPIVPAFRPKNEHLRHFLWKKWLSYVDVVKGNMSSSDESFKSYDVAEDLAYRILSNLVSLSPDERHNMLNIQAIDELAKAVAFVLEREKDIFLLEEEITDSVKRELEQENKKYIQRKKVELLQKELGGDCPPELESLELELSDLPLTDANRKKVDAELKKLSHTPVASPEYSLSQHYLNWVVDIPWGKYSEANPTIEEAKGVLDKDHFGLDKAKDRILESLAVQIRTGKISGSILCLMGPPGVGKTSLGESIAVATDRKFVRIAVGGVKDEAEFRGHRRTYVGAMPGKIIKALKSAGTMNPCVLLDEIDKMGSDFRGDPSSALLEVLDPEQNSRFNDHFMDMDIDLSKILFITTANTWDIPAPLLDRMEVIELSSYTETEKISIAQKYLVKKSLHLHGLASKEIRISKTIIQKIIKLYTKEAGVRELERMIHKILRKRVREILEGKEFNVALKQVDLYKYLGVPIYDEELMLKKSLVGVSQGLAWTRYGGALLNIESAAFPGQGKLSNTGSLGDVMQESIQAALTVTRTIGAKYNMDETFFDKMDIHVHLPEGATPKDGPSAGITLCTALISMITKVPVKSNVAMTGEINLRGEVLAIGGLKEKLLAALQAKISDVMIPKDNAREIEELPEEVKAGVKIHVVENIDQVLNIALLRALRKSDFPKKEKSE